MVTIQKPEELLSLDDPLRHIREMHKKHIAGATAKLQPTVAAKGWIGRLDPFRRKRYEKARRRWSLATVVQPNIYDSPLQEASHLMRELAISLEAAKDEKRLAVAKRVIVLLQDPNILGHKLGNVLTEDHLNAEGIGSSIKEWLGGMRTATPPSHTLPARGKTEPAKSRDWFGLAIPPEISPADEAAVATMLEHGVGDWFAPGFDSNELDRLTGGNALLALGLALHARHGWESTLGVPPATMETFLRTMQASYKPVAYHNSRHASGVAHGPRPHDRPPSASPSPSALTLTFALWPRQARDRRDARRALARHEPARAARRGRVARDALRVRRRRHHARRWPRRARQRLPHRYHPTRRSSNPPAALRCSCSLQPPAACARQPPLTMRTRSSLPGGGQPRGTRPPRLVAPSSRCSIRTRPH